MLLLNKLHSNIEKVNYKKRLLKLCVEMIKQRIAAAAIAIENAQSAANAEEKSSAGDKYETSRAMSHLEKDMYSRQLLANQQELEALSNVDCDKLYDNITIGSIVFCKEGAFFIAAGLGKINFEGIEVYLVSPLAPMAKMVFNKQAGDVFTFKKMELLITATF